MIKKLIKIVLVLFVVGVLILTFQKPSHTRSWERESQTLPIVTISDDTIHIAHVRDFTYSPSSITDYGYTQRSINLSDVEKAYFIVQPFSKWKAVGHTFLTFDIKGQEPISFSIEARREDDEGYSAIKGMFNTYELMYVWGQETDLIARRSVYLNDPLHMYELQLTQEGVQKLFKGLAQKTIELEHTPQFYNTLFTNCTNELASIANSVTPGKIPFHYSLIFTGYSDTYLYKLGLLKNETSFDDLEKDSYITDIVKETYQDEDFSEKVREILKK